MKKANKIKVQKWVNNKLVETEKIVCAYCGSGQIYPLKKKKNVIYCRMCGNESKVENKK